MVAILCGRCFKFERGICWDFRWLFSYFYQPCEEWQVTFSYKWVKQAKKAPKVPATPIPRSTAPAFNNVELAIEADRLWFAEHPEDDEYIREFCPGEFGAVKLPYVQLGFRRVTLVTVIHRTNGVADGRYRRMIAVSDDA
jgi:hypothetical protein